MGICSLVEWFAMQMLATMVVRDSDHHLVNRPEFRPPYEYRYAIKLPRGDLYTLAMNQVLLKLSQKTLRVWILRLLCLRLIPYRSQTGQMG